MKALQIITTFLISLLSLTEGVAQYAQEINHPFSNLENSEITELIENIALHKGAPDSLTNKTDLDIFVTIRDSKGKLHPGLRVDNRQGGNPRFTDTLKTGRTGLINAKVFRRGQADTNKVDLIINIPGVKNAGGKWEYRPVKWSLGNDHNPPLTEIKYLNPRKGYQIIFIYNNGLPKSETESDKDHKMYHIDAHICRPTNDNCL